MSRSGTDRDDLFRKTGFMFAGLSGAYILIFAIRHIFGISNNGHGELEPSSTAIVVAVSGLCSVLATLNPAYYWIQPVILLAITPLPMMIHIDSMYGIGTFIFGLILLYKLDFFARRRLRNVMLMASYFILCQILAALASGIHVLVVLTSILFSFMFLAFLLLVYREKIVVYLSSPKPSLSLGELGITKMEALYLRYLLGGSTIKEIAINSGVKESTVRNTLAHVYRKFGVADKSALFAKCEHFTIVD